MSIFTYRLSDVSSFSLLPSNVRSDVRCFSVMLFAGSPGSILLPSSAVSTPEGHER